VDFQQIFVHRDWKFDSASYDADIAIVLLNNEIIFTQSIQPICLPRVNSNVYNVKGTVVGYGFAEGRILPDRQKHVVISSVEDRVCLYKVKNLVHIGSER
jgi:hypothetical protein